MLIYLGNRISRGVQAPRRTILRDPWQVGGSLKRESMVPTYRRWVLPCLGRRRGPPPGESVAR